MRPRARLVATLGKPKHDPKNWFLKFNRERYVRLDVLHSWRPRSAAGGGVTLLVCLNCGLRAGELWGLQSGDIKDQSLYIKREWSEREKKFDLPKGKRNRKSKDRPPYRHVFLQELAKQELLDVIKQRSVKSAETVFYGEELRPRGHVSFRHRFKRLVRDWGGKRIRFHDLRLGKTAFAS